LRDGSLIFMRGELQRISLIHKSCEETISGLFYVAFVAILVIPG
jgi:hypothetical protein